MELFNIIKKIKNKVNEPLFKNSYFLMANTIFYSLVGFIFWIIASRLYSPENVGIGSAIVSAMGIISIFSLMGFDISLIRYIPDESDKKGMINSCFTLTTIMSIIISIVFITGLNFWSPALIILKNNFTFSIAFIIFTIFSSLSILQISVFTALRNTKYSFFQSITNILRLISLPFFILFGSFGIYLSFGLTYMITFFVGNMLISKIYSIYKLTPVIKKHFIYRMLHYSFGNYIANIFLQLPTFLLPLLVINILNAEMNAYFYVSWTFSLILLTIPTSTSKSLLAEGSFSPEEFNIKIVKSMKFTIILQLIAIFGILIFGKNILLLFGKQYAENSFELLLILCIASIPYAINQIYTTINRVQKNIKPVILIYGSISTITLIGSYFVLSSIGLLGIGYVWLATNSVIAILISLKSIKKYPIRNK